MLGMENHPGLGRQAPEQILRLRQRADLPQLESLFRAAALHAFGDHGPEGLVESEGFRGQLSRATGAGQRCHRGPAALGDEKRLRKRLGERIEKAFSRWDNDRGRSEPQNGQEQGIANPWKRGTGTILKAWYAWQQFIAERDAVLVQGRQASQRCTQRRTQSTFRSSFVRPRTATSLLSPDVFGLAYRPGIWNQPAAAGAG